MKEIEVKFKIENIKQIREKVKETGAKRKSKVIEQDLGFDTKQKKLKQKGQLLRIRRADGNVYLTFKSPRKSNHFKEMEELELGIEDFNKMKQILKRLGFLPQRGFKKERETWQYKNSEILIDQLGFANFLEIEGSKKEIKEITELLDLDWSERMTDNYLEVYQQYCKEKGIKEQKFF